MGAMARRKPAGRYSMSEETLRAWALVSVSLFNTVLLLWLGLTLWLHADRTDPRRRRDPGVLVAGGGFLLGSVFFISHSALLLSTSWEVTRSNTLWLTAAMLPVLVLPYAWYAVLLHNAGYWSEPQGSLRRRHRPWLLLLSAILVAGFASLVLLGAPFVEGLSRLTPFIWPLRQLIKIPVAGIPLVAIGYPFYVLLCVGLSIDTLRSQIADAGPGEASAVAFRRSRGQLIAASLVLLLVSSLVAVAVVWTITNTREGDYYVLRVDDIGVIAAFDFTIALLIGVVTILLGQAITRYELFTGKTLPRRGLAGQWVQAIALAAGYGVLLGGALVLGLEPVYAVLLTAVLMTFFFALLSWRSSVEWRQAMRQLRPVVSSQGWYDRLVEVAGESPDRLEVDAFRALCEDILAAPLAFLLPVGPLASFVTPRAHPAAAPLPVKAWAPDTTAAQHLATPVSPGEYGGASWAIPLWSERGLTGVLLLGSPVDGRLYSEEELEIARATGERMIDAAASLALSRKLMDLQRERMVQTQLLDQRTRRVLHDEVLPLIHTAMLSVASGERSADALARLSDAHREVSALLRDLPAIVTPDVSRLGPLAALRKAVEGEFAPALASVSWEGEPEAERRAALLSPLQAETLYYAGRELVRNAAQHARPPGGGGCALRVDVSCDGGMIRVVVEDNGEGWDGRVEERAHAHGHGLELHTALMAIAGGSLAVEARAGGSARGVLLMPARMEPGAPA